MFLDEELEIIFNKEHDSTKDKAIELLTACLNRIGEDKSFTNMKRINNSYNLFAKRHEGLKLDVFKNYVIDTLGEEYKIIFD